MSDVGCRGLFLGLVYVLLEPVLRMREDLPGVVPWIHSCCCPVYPWSVDKVDWDHFEQKTGAHVIFC